MLVPLHTKRTKYQKGRCSNDYQRFDLLKAAPIKDMESKKVVAHGMTYGLSEAGYDIRIKQEIRFYPVNRDAELF